MSDYLQGWEHTETKKGLGGSKFTRERDVIGVGTTHAVPPGDNVSLCNRNIAKTGTEWPPGMGTPCSECVEKVAEDE